MIRSFADAETQTVFLTGRSRKIALIPESPTRVVARKLLAIDFASAVEDLIEPPGSRLEKLKGDREGQWSIQSDTGETRNRFRVCFRWDGEDVWDVEIVDYH